MVFDRHQSFESFPDFRAVRDEVKRPAKTQRGALVASSYRVSPSIPRRRRRGSGAPIYRRNPLLGEGRRLGFVSEGMPARKETGLLLRTISSPKTVLAAGAFEHHHERARGGRSMARERERKTDPGRKAASTRKAAI